MNDLRERLADQLVLAKAENIGPGRIDGAQHARAARDNEQVARIAPDAVALAGAGVDFGGQRIVQAPQLRFADTQAFFKALMSGDVVSHAEITQTTRTVFNRFATARHPALLTIVRAANPVLQVIERSGRHVEMAGPYAVTVVGMHEFQQVVEMV